MLTGIKLCSHSSTTEPASCTFVLELLVVIVEGIRSMVPHSVWEISPPPFPQAQSNVTCNSESEVCSSAMHHCSNCPSQSLAFKKKLGSPWEKSSRCCLVYPIYVELSSQESVIRMLRVTIGILCVYCRERENNRMKNISLMITNCFWLYSWWNNYYVRNFTLLNKVHSHMQMFHA